jgi:hypothetical protein
MSDEPGKLLPFKRPNARARLERPTASQRTQLFDALLATAASAEADPDIVGYALIFLRADGTRLSDWGARTPALGPLARQVRQEASVLAKEVHREWPA